MNFLADLDHGAIRQQHQHRHLQPFPASVDDRDRAISPLGRAEDFECRSIKWVERIEDLHLGAIRAQGIVGADVIIPMSTAWPPRAASLPTTPIGYLRATGFSCRSRCSAGYFVASSSPDSRPPSTTTSSRFTVTSQYWRNH